MGSGIAEVCARSGVDVTVVEADDGRVERRARRSTSRSTAPRAPASSTRRTATPPASGSPTARARGPRGRRRRHRGDRRERERQARPVPPSSTRSCPTPTFLASNTSSVPIMKLGAETSQPERVLGLHFFNPVPVLPLVEVVRSIMTSEQTIDRAHRSPRGRSARPRSTPRTAPASSSTRCSSPTPLRVRMYESGFAAKEDIDRGMVKGCAHPMGPLALADLIGLDTLLAVSRVALRGVPRPRLRRPRAAQPDGRGGPARPQVRARLLRLLELNAGLSPRRRRAEPGVVVEHDRLHAVAEAELREQPGDVR